jgi:hypothetical protein
MHSLPCRGSAASIRGFNIKNGPREPRRGEIKKCYLSNTPMSGVHLNFCYINSLVKHTVWPEEVFQPEKASRDQIFFKHTQKPFPKP